jgi:hypothetical protein
MSPFDALLVLVGLVVLIGGVIACAVSGNWAGLFFVIPISIGAFQFAGRGGRDGLPPASLPVRVVPGLALTRRGLRPFVAVRPRRRR